MEWRFPRKQAASCAGTPPTRLLVALAFRLLSRRSGSRVVEPGEPAGRRQPSMDVGSARDRAPPALPWLAWLAWLERVRVGRMSRRDASRLAQCPRVGWKACFGSARLGLEKGDSDPEFPHAAHLEHPSVSWMAIPSSFADLRVVSSLRARMRRLCARLSSLRCTRKARKRCQQALPISRCAQAGHVWCQGETQTPPLRGHQPVQRISLGFGKRGHRRFRATPLPFHSAVVSHSWRRLTMPL